MWTGLEPGRERDEERGKGKRNAGLSPRGWREKGEKEIRHP